MAVEFKNPITLTKDSTIYGHQSLDEGGFPKNAGNAKVSQILDLAEKQTIKNIQIGGRNYILNSDFAKGIVQKGYAKINGWEIPIENTSIATDMTFKGHKVLHRYRTGITQVTWSVLRFFWYDFGDLKEDLTFTFSAWCYLNKNGENDGIFSITTKYLSKSGSFLYLENASVSADRKKINQWQKVQFTAKIPAGLDAQYFYFFDSHPYNLDYYCTCFKLEIGNVATDWTPAPEDEIKTVSTEYYLSTSATELSGGSWSTTAPTWANGKYMWMRTVVTNGYGDKTYTPSENGACLSGAKGDKGASAGFGTPTASVDNNVGTPSVTVTTSGADTAKVFNFAFKNLKGNKGDAGTTTWAGITDKPTSFTPSAHNHDDRYYTESEIDTKLEGKANATHNHDDRYYTEAEITKSVTTGQLIAGKVLPRGEASDIGDSLQAFKNGYIETLDTTTVNAGSIQPKTASANIGSANQKFDQIYAGTVNASGTVNTATLNGANVNASSMIRCQNNKVEIGADNESGFVNIRNVDQGSDAIMWHLDICHNQLRFVRNSETVPAYITEKGIYGAKFNLTGLFSGAANNQTITLVDSLANYTFLFLKCQSTSGDNTFRMISVDFLRSNQNLWISLGGDDENGHPVFVQLKWSSETSLTIGLGRYGNVYSIDGV